MKHSNKTLKKYIADNALRVRMIVHDDFTHHEAYALCENAEGEFVVLIYTAPDDSMDVITTKDKYEAYSYILETVEATFSPMNERFDCFALVNLAKKIEQRSKDQIKLNLDVHVMHNREALAELF